VLRVLNDQEFFIACAGHSDGNPCLAPHAALLDAFKLQVRRIQPPAVPSKQSAPFFATRNECDATQAIRGGKAALGLWPFRKHKEGVLTQSGFLNCSLCLVWRNPRGGPYAWYRL